MRGETKTGPKSPAFEVLRGQGQKAAPKQGASFKNITFSRKRTMFGTHWAVYDVRLALLPMCLHLK